MTKINLFKKSYTNKEEAVFEFLSKNSLFVDLTEEEKFYFLPFLYDRKYKLDEIVFFRNDPSQALYLIRKGTVRQFIDIKENTETLRELGPSALFGENAILPKTRRIYNTIVTSDEAHFYVIPQVNILEIFDRRPRVMAKMLQALAEKCDHKEHNLVNIYRSSLGFFNLSEIYHS